MARYEEDGDPDPTFGGGDGLVTTNVQGRIDFGHAVVLQADGRIVVAGRASDGVANEDFGVVRYQDDGDLDPTFGGDGIALADFGSGSIAEGLVLQPDDKIVVVGSAGSDFAAARFEANGGPDLTFGGGDGVVTTDFDLGTGGFLGAEFGRDVALQADGSIVVVGQSEGDRNLGVVRYDSAGNLDELVRRRRHHDHRLLRCLRLRQRRRRPTRRQDRGGRLRAERLHRPDRAGPHHPVGSNHVIGHGAPESGVS